MNREKLESFPNKRINMEYVSWRLMGLPTKLYDQGKFSIQELDRVISGEITNEEVIDAIRTRADDWRQDVLEELKI